MLYDKSQALLSLQSKAILYPVEMTLGKRIKEARKALRMTQAVLGAAVGVTDKAVSGWERDKDSPTQDKFPKLAQTLKRDVAYLHGADSGERNDVTIDAVNQPARINVPTRNAPSNVFPVAEIMGDIDLPVYSIVQGGRGALILGNEPFTHTARPRRLIGIKDAYGVLVKGNSMAREYSENDIAYVDPNLNPRRGDPCVFQGERDDGSWEAMIKYLERSPDASETVYYVSQSNPEKKFTIKKADWQKCHVAVGKESGR